jgi:hypothetical protein
MSAVVRRYSSSAIYNHAASMKRAFAISPPKMISNNYYNNSFGLFSK